MPPYPCPPSQKTIYRAAKFVPTIMEPSHWAANTNRIARALFTRPCPDPKGMVKDSDNSGRLEVDGEEFSRMSDDVAFQQIPHAYKNYWDLNAIR